MIFNSGFSRTEIDSLTYRELFELVDLFYKQQYERMFDFFKMFCIANAESTAVANSESHDALNKYARELKNRSLTPDNNLNLDVNSQFEGIDFGKQH